MIRNVLKSLASWKVTSFAVFAAFVFFMTNSATAASTCTTSTSVETLFSSTDAPAVTSASDTHSAALGVRFQADAPGQVLGVKFYKGAGNTGTHVGYLWSAAGVLLSSVVFSNETSSGWQEALFTTPVNINANTAYVVSYTAPAGHYAYTHSYFTSSHISGDLTAFQDSSTSPDGVYTYTAGAFLASSYLSSNYWVDVEFTLGQQVSPSPSTSSSPSVSPSSSPSVSPSLSVAPSASVSSSSSPSASPSASGGSTAPAPNTGYVLPGTVGYLGDPNVLTVYQPGGQTPAGCSWQSYGLRCDQTDLYLDHVWLKGSLYWTGEGHLTITNSIVQGGTGSAWYAILGHPVNSGLLNSVITVTDSTVSWLPGETMPAGYDVAPIWSVYGNQALIVERDDLSGMPQGVDPTGGSLIEDNWIHNLFQNGTSSSPTHLDGIYSQGGGNILIQGNYVDVPVRSDTTASLFIQDRGATDTGIAIKDNYLSGGAYVLRNQTGIAVDVEGNVLGNTLYGYVGDLTGYPGTYGTWVNNVGTNGSAIPKP